MNVVTNFKLQFLPLEVPMKHSQGGEGNLKQAS
jgi:hypothetical protein